jgi:small-conductance mechanosensitive channel
MSRDWVIEKITIGITYDSDVEKARKIIKKIGLELAEDPEFKGKILEPLKMQGVEKFGDFAIELRLKMMTKPHEQYVPKRRALAMIKKRFEEGGIKFASPVVQIAGGSSATEAAAATVALERAQQAGAG